MPDPKVTRFLEDAPLFMRDWWLDAVAPGAWDYVVVRRGEDVAGVLAYACKVRLNRWRLIEMPDLTPYLGPWLRPSTAKYANRLSEEKELTQELIDGLPPFAIFHQDFNPGITNWLPFLWNGYHQTTRYTYMIEDTRDLKAVWSETTQSIRTDVRKAEKQVRVFETGDFEKFLSLHRLTFSRQNKPLPHSEETLRRLDAACAARGVRKILMAEGADGKPHAAVYLVADGRTV